MNGYSGHPRFYELTAAEQKLHNDKNHDYAAGGDPLGNFKRVAAIMALYPGFPVNHPAGVAMMFAMKQLDSVMWGLSKDIKHKVEGYGERLGDISVYAKLARIILEELAREQPAIHMTQEQLKRAMLQPGRVIEYRSDEELNEIKKELYKVKEAEAAKSFTASATHAPWLPSEYRIEAGAHRDAKG